MSQKNLTLLTLNYFRRKAADPNIKNNPPKFTGQVPGQVLAEEPNLRGTGR